MYIVMLMCVQILLCQPDKQGRCLKKLSDEVAELCGTKSKTLNDTHGMINWYNEHANTVSITVE